MMIDCKIDSVSVDRESKNVFASLVQPCATHGNEPVTSLSRIISSASRHAETPLPFHTVETKVRKQLPVISKIPHLGVFARFTHRFMTYFNP